jgi:hypothetical protein
MSLFIAYNSALSTTTNVDGGTSYTAGAKVAIQLRLPDTAYINVIEYGVSFDGSAAATPATVELATTDTGSTVSTAHTTTTVTCLNHNPIDSRLTYGTTSDTGYGNGTITSNATLRPLDRQFVAPTNQYVKMWPLGREPIVGNSTTENFLQLRIDTNATVNAIAYIVWEEHI